MRFVGINFLLCFSIPYVHSIKITRMISNGVIEGSLLTTKANNTAFAFLGVPFGQNPIGELRFRKPIQPHPWSGTLNCTTEKAGCIGDDTKDSQSEDCLYLDILQPQQCQPNSTSCAIFVYAHSDLTTDLHSFIDNLVQDDIIVVVVPHRQGVLGFLNLPSMPNEYDQNAGIHDLILALKFVNKEIVQFGGDKTNLTVGGHGDGAQLVGYLTLSSIANPLFSRAVALSGAPEMNHKLTSGANSVLSEQLVNLNKCHQHAHTMSCMRKLSANALLSTGYFGPTIDNDVFVANTNELRKTRKPLPYLIGVSSQNASHHYSTEESCLKAAHSLALPSQLVAEKCKQHYDNTDQMPIFDADTVLPIFNEASSMAQKSNETYLYSVVDYYDDPYQTYTNASRIFSQLLTNFIKYGRPGLQWRPLGPEEYNYLQLSAAKATINNAPLFHWNAINFWKQVAPSLQLGYEFRQSEDGDYVTAFWVAVCIGVVLFMIIAVQTTLRFCSNRRNKMYRKYSQLVQQEGPEGNTHPIETSSNSVN